MIRIPERKGVNDFPFHPHDLGMTEDYGELECAVDPKSVFVTIPDLGFQNDGFVHFATGINKQIDGFPKKFGVLSSRF